MTDPVAISEPVDSPVQHDYAPVTVASSLSIGAGGLLILGIQPILLGGLIENGVLNDTSLGWSATIEILSVALGVFLGPRLLVKNPRLVIIVAALLMAFANLATPMTAHVDSVLLARGAAGLAEGILVAVAVLVITYSSSPARISAAFLTVGAVPQMLMAYMLPAWISPHIGVGAGFAIMGMIGFACAVLAFGVREPLVPGGVTEVGKLSGSPMVLLSLATTLVTSSAIGACWSYADRFGAEIGLSADQVGVCFTASLVFQILAGLVVALVGWRLSFKSALFGGAVLQIVAVLGLLESRGFVGMISALSLFGLLWQGCLPFASDLMVSVDTSRKSAPLVLPLTCLGLSIGPFVASFFVATGARSALQVGLWIFVAAAFLYGILFWRMSQHAGRVAEVAS